MGVQVATCCIDMRWPFETSPEIPVKVNLGPHAQWVRQDSLSTDNEQLALLPHQLLLVNSWICWSINQSISQLTHELLFACAHSNVCFVPPITNTRVTLIKHGNCNSFLLPPVPLHLFINVCFCPRYSRALRHWRANWLHLDHLSRVVFLPHCSLNCSVLNRGKASTRALIGC